MAQIMKIFVSCTFLLFLMNSNMLHAAVKVAVASNFTQTLTEIAHLYETQTGQKVLISSASTGTLYNQIMHGAPFDLFLSADSERAEKLENSSFAINGSRFTYAIGQLAYWQPNSKVVTESSLRNFKGRLSIANPKLAPYGLAAKQALIKLKLWVSMSVVQGTNIAQAYQFVDTRSAKAGLVAYSLLLQNEQKDFYLLSPEYYEPIRQQGVQLDTNNISQTKQFIDYLKSPEIQKFIQSKGYL